MLGGAAWRAHRRFVALLALGLGVCEELLAVRALVERCSLVAVERVELVCVQSGLQEGGSGGGEVEVVVVVVVGKEWMVAAVAARRHLQFVFLIAEALELVGAVEIGEAGDELLVEAAEVDRQAHHLGAVVVNEAEAEVDEALHLEREG